MLVEGDRGQSWASWITMSSDIYRYQRIETLALLPAGLAWVKRSRLISKSACLTFKRFNLYLENDNNFLALSPDFQGWFDGSSTHQQLPLFKVDYVSCSLMEVLLNRYEVTLLIEAFDINCATTIFRRIKEGSSKGDIETRIVTSVLVSDPEIFKECLRWKSNDTQRKWEKFRLESEQNI